jgi:hypothetical protein
VCVCVHVCVPQKSKSAGGADSAHKLACPKYAYSSLHSYHVGYLLCCVCVLLSLCVCAYVYVCLSASASASASACVCAWCMHVQVVGMHDVQFSLWIRSVVYTFGLRHKHQEQMHIYSAHGIHPITPVSVFQKLSCFFVHTCMCFFNLFIARCNHAWTETQLAAAFAKYARDTEAMCVALVVA